MSRLTPLILGLAAALAVAAPAFAADRFFSYDPANATTRRLAGDLTFEFRQTLVWQRVVAVRSTEGEATAELKPASEAELGRGGLTRLVGPGARDRALYAVEPTAEGAEMVRAFCPGSRRGWLAFSRLSEDEPLRIQVIGDSPSGGPTRLCQTFDFTFHGEWRLPPGRRVSASDLLNPKPPY